MSWLSRFFDPLRSAREANDAMIASAKKRELAKLTVEKQIASIQLDYDYNERGSNPMPFWEFEENVGLKDRYRQIALTIQSAPKGTFSARQLHTAAGLLSEASWWTNHRISLTEMISLNNQLSSGQSSSQSESQLRCRGSRSL